MLTRRALRCRQCGLSLVEMMVGIAVGLFIVAAAAMMVSTQLGDNRRLLLETQVQQDLRATADIITRELRRSGALLPALAPKVVSDRVTGAVQPNIYQTVEVVSGPPYEVRFGYQRSGAAGPYRYKFVWVESDGVIRTLIGTGLQDLTDRNALIVTDFQVTPDAGNAQTVRLPCPKACPSPPPTGEPADYCWPVIGVRAYTVRITGQAASDPSVVRSVESHVRLRNEHLVNHPDFPLFCPT